MEWREDRRNSNSILILILISSLRYSGDCLVLIFETLALGMMESLNKFSIQHRRSLGIFTFNYLDSRHIFSNNCTVISDHSTNDSEFNSLIGKIGSNIFSCSSWCLEIICCEMSWLSCEGLEVELSTLDKSWLESFAIHQAMQSYLVRLRTSSQL